ncbi:hypothetical protein M0804_009366 [Polistes exclamans]|nr:hypothetical protein M0804_009366 [Polistes exclamans]
MSCLVCKEHLKVVDIPIVAHRKEHLDNIRSQFSDIAPTKSDTLKDRREDWLVLRNTNCELFDINYDITCHARN